MSKIFFRELEKNKPTVIIYEGRPYTVFKNLLGEIFVHHGTPAQAGPIVNATPYFLMRLSERYTAPSLHDDLNDRADQFSRSGVRARDFRFMKSSMDSPFTDLPPFATGASGRQPIPRILKAQPTRPW